MILEIALFPLPSPLSSPPPLFCSSSFEADTVGRREGEKRGGGFWQIPSFFSSSSVPSFSLCQVISSRSQEICCQPFPFSRWHRFLPYLPSPSRSNTFPYVPTCRLWYLRPSLPLAPLSFLVPSSPTQFFFFLPLSATAPILLRP